MLGEKKLIKPKKYDSKTFLSGWGFVNDSDPNPTGKMAFKHGAISHKPGYWRNFHASW